MAYFTLMCIRLYIAAWLQFNVIYVSPYMYTALLPIIARYQLSPDKIQIDITRLKVHPKSSK